MEKTNKDPEPEKVEQSLEPLSDEEGKGVLSDVQKTEPTDNAGESLIFDTTNDYELIFGENPRFDSWEEFASRLELFSKRTGFYFKPRSACTVEYVNETRVSSPIADRFVYAKVRMICVHYGEPPKPETVFIHRKDSFSYVSKGCDAYIQVSYSRGSLHIGRLSLIHKNHSPQKNDEGAPVRYYKRAFSFTQELDLKIAEEVLRNNPFEMVNGEKRWVQAVEILKGSDERLASLTPRLVKKRIRFLTDKFATICQGRKPVAEDKLGIILYELEQSKQKKIDNPPPRGRKRKHPRKANASSPRSKVASETDKEEADLDHGMSALEEDDIPTASPPKKNRKKARSPSPPPVTASSSSLTSESLELKAFLAYLKRKDEEDRKLRQQELELNRENMELRKREMEFSRERYQFEKQERSTQLELLKSQVAILDKTVAIAGAMKHHVKEMNNQPPMEYTIVLNENQQEVGS